MIRFTPLLSAYLVLFPPNSLAFGSRSHHEITRKALSMASIKGQEEVPCTLKEDLKDFHRYLYETLIWSGAPEVPMLLKRWPDRETFLKGGLKDLLDLSKNPKFRIVGIDWLPCARDETVAEILIRESVTPDEDGRNQERVFEEAKKTLPEDPIVLDMGGVEGLASQAHAHYILAEWPFGWLSRDNLPSRLDPSLWALLSHPSHFALATYVPEGPVTLGADMAMTHFLLALLASSWPDEASRRLSLTFLAHALHYVQDASDPLHTVQVGHPCLALHGGVAFAMRVVVSGGGLLFRIKGPASSVADVVSNLHLWVEHLWDRRGVVHGPPPWYRIESWWLRHRVGDLATAMLAPWWASENMRPFGPLLYGLSCKAVKFKALGYGSPLEDGHIEPEALVANEDHASEVERIGRLSASVAMAASAMLMEAFDSLAPLMRKDQNLRRLVASLLVSRMRAVVQREERLKDFLLKHPEGIERKPFRLPFVAFVEVAFLGLLGALLIRRLR